MPKTIDYPRTSYLSAWEVAEVVDDFGGKCSVEACARKLNRKVSGSFKAILGSAVKFGLLVSKREILTTTNLFRRIKHAYDKAEEKVYHREAFLHPPLFTHICRKFRNRELPVHMFDVMLVREFDVEEINAQAVAKAFVEGARMVDVLDERNFIADIDQLTKPAPRRDLASPEMSVNLFAGSGTTPNNAEPTAAVPGVAPAQPVSTQDDAVASLFGFSVPQGDTSVPKQATPAIPQPIPVMERPSNTADAIVPPQAYGVAPTSSLVPVPRTPALSAEKSRTIYTIHIAGPGLDSQLSLQDESDLVIVQALLEKIRKHLST